MPIQILRSIYHRFVKYGVPSVEVRCKMQCFAFFATIYQYCKPHNELSNEQHMRQIGTITAHASILNMLIGSLGVGCGGGCGFGTYGVLRAGLYLAGPGSGRDPNGLRLFIGSRLSCCNRDSLADLGRRVCHAAFSQPFVKNGARDTPATANLPGGQLPIRQQFVNGGLADAQVFGGFRGFEYIVLCHIVFFSLYNSIAACAAR